MKEEEKKLTRRERRLVRRHEERVQRARDAQVRKELGAVYAQFDRKSRETPKPQGMPVSCKRGCAGCCKQLVAVTLAEADLIYRRHRALVRSRMLTLSDQVDEIESIPRDESNGDALSERKLREVLANGWWAKQLNCVFLNERNECMIYEERPLACRQHVVFSDPALCHEISPAEVAGWFPPFYFDVTKKMFKVNERLYGKESQIAIGPMPIVLLQIARADLEREAGMR